MTQQEIDKLKELATEASQSMPAHLMMDGKGNVYCNGHPVSMPDLLCDIDRALTKVNEVHAAVMNIKGRQAGK